MGVRGLSGERGDQVEGTREGGERGEVVGKWGGGGARKVTDREERGGGAVCVLARNAYFSYSLIE